MTDTTIFDQSAQVGVVRAAVRGVYDLQTLRIASGLRLCAQFRSRLELLGRKADGADDETDGDDESLEMHVDETEPAEEEDEAKAEQAAREKEAQKIVKKLKESYRRLTDGVARNRSLPQREGFVGDELISTHSELVLVDYYLGIEKAESRQFRQLEELLAPIPVYEQWLRHQEGVGPAVAGILIAYFDPGKGRYPSSYWKYAGLDVGPDNAGRSRRAEHMIDREYRSKSGEIKTRKSLTYEPFLKTKLTGVMATCFLRQGAQPWRDIYDGYKHRLQTDPNREKITVGKWKTRYKNGGPDAVRHLWTPGRIHRASVRYMVKQFLVQYWEADRLAAGLPIRNPNGGVTYGEAKMGLTPHPRNPRFAA